MRVTVSIREINSAFDKEYAEREHGGEESEDNILCTWEDELEVNEDVTSFKILNNTVYELQVEKDGQAHSFPIEGMTVCECTGASGNLTRFAVSRKLIRNTEKKIAPNGDVHFFFFIKDKHPMVNPLIGVYISLKDFPKELPVPKPEEDEAGDEDDFLEEEDFDDEDFKDEEQ